jgi:hypothetical protein
MRRLVSAVVLSFIVACGSESSATSPANDSVAGTWDGSSGNIGISMTLAQSGSVVTGDGHISGATSVAFTVTGTFAKPNASLTLTAQGFQPMNYSGTLSGGFINGTLNGSGFVNAALPLTKR